MQNATFFEKRCSILNRQAEREEGVRCGVKKEACQIGLHRAEGVKILGGDQDGKSIRWLRSHGMATVKQMRGKEEAASGFQMNAVFFQVEAKIAIRKKK